MKSRGIKISFISLLVLLVISILPLYKGDNLYQTIGKTISSRQYQSSLDELRQENYNKMKIDYVNIKSRITGTEPFNDGTVSDTEGVDVSANDNYVRTFDIIKYTLDLGISSNTSVSGVTDSSTFNGGVIKVRAKLPNQGDLVFMTWEQDAWMQNVSYNDDKTEIYAEYHVPEGVSITNANQNLTFTIKVGGYKKEVTDDMKPIFEVWMEGNEPDDSTSNVESIITKDNTSNLIISGKPSYDVVLKSSTYNSSGSKGDLRGQYIAYGLGIALIQPVEEFSDLRGVEYPTGEFVVELENSYLVRDVDNGTNYVTIDENSSNSLGVLNNTSLVAYSVNGVNNDDYYPNNKVYTRDLPYGNGGGDRAVTDSGKMNLNVSNTTTTISFDDYVLNGEYPVRNTHVLDTSISFPDTLGYFAIGNVQLFVPYYNTTGNKSYDYSYKVKAKNITYKDTSGKEYKLEADLDGNKSNNSVSIGFSSRPKGSFYVMSQLYSNNSNPYDGLSSSVLGGYINPVFTLMPVDGPYEGGAERLVTWNNDYFTLVENDGSYAKADCYSEIGVECPSDDSIEFKYGVLKENSDTGITTEEEVNTLTKNEFNWYDSALEALENGKISAVYGYDHDVVGNRVHRRIKLKLQVTSDLEKIGSVGTIVHRTIVYGDEDKTQIFEPFSDSNYVETQYNEEGVVTTNHSPSNLGISVLVLGTKASVLTSVSDVDSTGALKKSYDVRDSEINVKLTPSLSNGKNATDDDRVIDVVTVKSILPNGLSYKNDSANKEPKEVVINSDGTTEIIWEYNNWKINHEALEYPEITYKAEISASLDNNTSFNISSVIFTEEDLRSVDFRTSNYGVIISNLAGSRTLKTVDKNIIETNQSFIVTNTIGNISQETLDNVKTIEILPTPNDANGSNFNGNYTLKINSLVDNQKIYYTTNNIENIGITLDQNGKKTIKEVDLANDSRWIEVGVGDEIPSSAKAIASSIDSIEPSVEVNYSFEVITNDNKADDIYAFVMNATSDNLMSAIKTNTIVVKVVSRSIEGLAFVDTNNNDIYDSNDKLLPNIEVTLLDNDKKTLSTTRTNNNGEYNFDNLDKGNYYIKFNVDDKYDIVDKGITDTSSKVNSDNVTDLISHDEEVITENTMVSNINLGVRIKQGKVIVRHYIDGTTTSLSNDITDTYDYDEQYETDVAKDIPNNYQLKIKPDNYIGIVDRKETEVIYYYEKKPSELTTSINKIGTDEINSKDSKISYTINYQSNIKDYIGDGKITVIDYLPYEIDEKKSNLDGGIYNSEDNTITWSKELIGIDTYNNENNNIIITKNIELVYKDVEIKDIVNKAVGLIKLDNNEKQDETNMITKVKIPSTIITHYYLEGTTKKLAQSDLTNGLVGEHYNSIPKEIEGYELLKQPREMYIYEEEQQTIIYEYRKIDNPETLDSISKYIIVFVSSILIILVSGLVYKRKKILK